MPVVTMPDGTPVSFPDAMPPDQIRGLILQKFPDAAQRAAQPAATDTSAPSLGDYAKTNPVLGATAHTVLRAGQGIEQLIAHSAADLSDLGGHFPNKISDFLRGASDRVDTALANSEKSYQGAKQRVVNASTNPRVTNAAINTGEIEGNLLNPAGLAGNVVKSAPGVLNAAARGAVSGGAVAATQPVDNPADFYTEKGKQVATGAAVGGVTGATAEKLGAVKPPAEPKSSTFKELATESYDASKATGATVPRSDFEAAINNAEADARKDVTYRPSLQPKAATAIAQIKEDLAAAGNNVTFEDMDVARRVARTVLTSPDKNERAVAHTIIDGIDNYVDSLNSPEGTALATARDNFARGAKLDTIERLVTKAEDRIGANQTRTKLDNAIRQDFAGLLRNQRAARQFSPQEQDAIRAIVKGTPTQNAGRWVGKIAPTTGGPILGELLVLGHSMLAGSPAEAAGIIGAAGAGLAGQHVADTIGRSNVTTLKNLVAGRPNASPAPRPAPNAFVGNAPANLTIKALLQPRAQ